MPSLPDVLAAALGDRYRLERELGQGGMATVYLAEDTRHQRRVAIKVLRPELAAVIGARRFLAEIRTTANLQHPHILPLHDSGEVDGTVFYVMPFVDGESLRERLTRETQLPVDAAVRIATEVADALQHAHERGVIHRDIKPENILLQGGHALVADFGIALAASGAGGGRMTETGMSLGTPTYMSPEQAMGDRAVDARTDVYALGCVLYEMLVGEAPFRGPTAQAIIARVVTDEPRPISAERRTVPPHVDAAVMTALAKLPADRFASAREFSQALAGERIVSGPRPRHPGPAGSNGRQRALVGGLVTALALTTALAAWGWLRPGAEPPLTRSFVGLAAAEAPRMLRPSYAMLPDGSGFVYVGGEGGDQIWIKKRTDLRATPLPGTDGAQTVFVSPDGQWIGFVAGGRVLKVPVAGGPPVAIGESQCATSCEMFGSGTFLDDGRVVYRSRDALVIAAGGGGPVDTLVTSQAIGGFAASQPSPLPDSRGVLFTACTRYCDRADVWVVDVATRKTSRLVERAAYPAYAPTGHLLYVDAGGVARAAPFDLASMTIRGTATQLFDRAIGGFSISRDGTLLYADGDPAIRSALVVVSRDGTEEAVDDKWLDHFGSMAVSPDGRRVAASIISAGEEHVWIKELSGGPPVRLTFGPSQNTSPTWTPDGQSVLFSSFEGDSARFIRRRADGTGSPEILRSGPDWVIESVVSRDGEWLVLREYRTDGARDIHVRRTRGDTTSRAIVATPFSDYSPALSPDGRWLGYASGQTSRPPEVWVVPFPDPGASRWQVSSEGGWEPVWSADGRELYFVRGVPAELVAVTVDAGAGFRVGPPRMLFSLAPYRRHPSHRAYDVLPDGRFVMIRDGTPSTGQLVMVQHWLGELKRSR